MKVPYLVVGVVLLGSGCVSMRDAMDAVRTRASNDFQCNPDEIFIETIEGDPESVAGMEVQGCGQWRAYAARCKVSQLTLNCDVSAASRTRKTAPDGTLPP